MERQRSSILVLAIALALPTAVTLPYFVLLNEQSAMLRQLSYGIGKTIQFLLPAFWVFLCLRLPLRLSLPRLSKWIAANLLFGICIFFAALLAYRFFLAGNPVLDSLKPIVHEKILALGIQSLGQYILLAAFYAMIHAFLEEYYWRWFVFGQLRHMLSLPSAAVVSAIGFTAHHIIILSVFFGFWSPYTWLFSLCIAVGGAAWAFLYEKEQALYGPWLSHAFVDASIFTIGFLMVGSQLM